MGRQFNSPMKLKRIYNRKKNNDLNCNGDKIRRFKNIRIIKIN